MLILSRRKGEFIVIGASHLIPLIKSNPALLEEVLSQPISICVNDVIGKKVRLGFIADRLYQVDRAEIYEKRRASNADKA